MTFDLTPDSIALDLLKRARLDTGDVVPLPVIVHNLSLILVPRAPRGCDGAIAEPFLFTDGTMVTLAHELGHHGMTLNKLPRPHDEQFVAAVGACLVIPSAAFRRALRWTSDRARLAKIFGVSETCIALRIGETTGEPHAVMTSRHVMARGQWDWPAGDVLRRMVRERSKWLRVERLGDAPTRLLVRAA